MSRTKVILIVTSISAFSWVAAAFLKTQPKISTDNGELIIESAEDKNITFRLTESSSFFVNDIDILDFAGRSKRGTALISHTLGFSIMEDINIIKRTMLAVQESLVQIENRLRNETEGVLERISESMNSIQATIIMLESKIRENNCASNPCENGGSCIDLFDDFYCQCLKSWQGKTCKNDVDECLKFNGTNLGCQNNSTCINFAGGYRCYCKPGWLGIHCTKRESDCMNSPPGELCGHGTCIAENSPIGFTCICDQGWKSNAGTPACTVDVDECAEEKHNCKSGCVNLHGSFVCSPCSNGYTGNGVICTDIDECEINNGGCSLAPKTECINSEGSYRCGSCPPDWTGDGKSCTRTQTHDCSSTNICYPLAECQVISNVYVCICPSGMTGSGYGPNGCTIIQTDPCEPNPCLNGGSCVRRSENNNLFNCICVHGHGPKCEFAIPCATNPCKNGGTCVVQSESPGYRCDCRLGFEGVFCDRVFTLCGSIVRSPAGSGTIRFPRLGNYRAAERCAWLLRTNPDQVLVVNFTKFDLQDSEECRKDFLQINDGSSVASPLIGRFCGSSLPKGFTSAHHQLYFWFRSDDIIEAEGFVITWNSTKPICGGRIVVESHGTIQSPGYPGKSPSNRECEWELVGPPDKIIQLTFFEVEFPNRTDCYGDYLEVLDDFEERREILKLCETNLPPRLQTSSNVAIIHFHTDGSRSDSSFKAHYTLLEKPIQCGGIFSGPSGIFESPKITNNLEQFYLFCRYVIYSLPNSRIELNFDSYKFESLPFYRVSGECKLFSLEVSCHLLKSKYYQAFNFLKPRNIIYMKNIFSLLLRPCAKPANSSNFSFSKFSSLLMFLLLLLNI